MKNILIVFSFIMAFVSARADISYMPFRFDLSTAKDSYAEGESVEFVLKITNTDKSNSYPVLLPGTQNSGLKLIYLRFFDIAGNISILRGEESREIRMISDKPGKLERVNLGPGKSVSYSFFWNNPALYDSHTPSHHSFGFPLFAGEYRIRAVYDPEGTGPLDTTYNYMDGSHDEQASDKLNFYRGGAISSECILKIRKAPEGDVTIEGVTYKCRRYEGGIPFQYFINDFNDTNLVHHAYIHEGQSRIFSSEYSNHKGLFKELISRNEKGEIWMYRKYRDSCPHEMLVREFNEKGELVYSADMLRDGSIHNASYDSKKRFRYEGIYSPDGKTYRLTTYEYSDDEELPEKEVIIRKDPCNVVVEGQLE